MSCFIARLTADGRFEAIIDGDLDHNLRARGSWTVNRDGHVLLNGDQQPQIRERVAGVTGGIRFRVVDQKGEFLPIMTAILTCQTSRVTLHVAEGKLYPHDSKSESSLRLGPDGFVQVSNCRPSEFHVEFYSRHSVRYSPTDKASDEFVFVLDTNTNFYVTNEKYLWKPGYLYPWISRNAGGEWSEFPLELKNP
jgi:hypothetical protein